MGNTDRNIAQFRKGLDAFNASDWGTLSTLTGQDCQTEDYSTGASVRGRAASIDYQRSQKESFPDLTSTVDTLGAFGNFVFAEMTARGTNTAPLRLPTGSEMPATGKAVETRTAVISEYDDAGLTISTHVYTNPLTVAEQLGLLQVPQQVDLAGSAPVTPATR